MKDCTCVPGKESLKSSSVMAGSRDLTSKSETVNLPVNSCVANVHSVTGLPQKKGVNPNYCHNYTETKYVKDVSCKSCHKCPNCCHRSTCRGKTAPVLGKMGSSGFESQGSNSTQRGLHCHKQLCQPTKTPPPFGGTVSAEEQKCSRTGNKPKIPGILQPAIFGTQTQQSVEPYLGPEHLEHLSKHRVVQNGDTRDNKNLPTGRGVGYLHRFQGCKLPYTDSQSVQEVHVFSCPGSVPPVQTLPFGLSTAPMEF